MDHPKFVIEAEEATKMAEKLGLKSVLQLLPILVKSGQKLARPTISNFPVAAAGLTTDGRVFLGVNVEFPGLPLHHSIHAEQFLITNISNHQEIQLSSVVVSSYPCGHCRQFLQEIRGAPAIQIFVPSTEDPTLSFESLDYFLPHRFGPDDLLDKDVPLILETHDNHLVLGSEINGIRVNGFKAFQERDLVMAALEAANRSHAPYSGCCSGLALIDEDGRIYRGSYMESAAYSPSLSPAQAAVVAFLAARGGGGGGGGGEYERLVGAVLVEMEGAVVRQEETVRLFFKAVAPKCEFFVFHCKRNSDSSSLGKVN